LTMALPSGPDPDAPAEGVRFDLLVDFPSLPSSGLLRVDRFVNPVLGDLVLADLASREITVFRSGLVRIDGVDHPPRPDLEPRLAPAASLAPRAVGAPPPPPEPVSDAHGYVGLELDTLAAPGAVRVEELVLD